MRIRNSVFFFFSFSFLSLFFLFSFSFLSLFFLFVSYSSCIVALKFMVQYPSASSFAPSLSLSDPALRGLSSLFFRLRFFVLLLVCSFHPRLLHVSFRGFPRNLSEEIPKLDPRWVFAKREAFSLSATLKRESLFASWLLRRLESSCSESKSC